MNATDVLRCEVLVVGAGGIGCELLKNLVLENFGKITVIDLDTIDISNLNRQFLFQKIHVGRSKAEVAKESVMRFRPKCEITAFHKSIFSSVFDTDFFSRFDLVFNALDNHAARRHVNRMCVATKVPLIESGTAGYLGQVEPLIPSGLLSLNCVHDKAESNTTKEDFRTGCYECQPRGSGQRTYPACTIRNTPSEPIHCVVWAKYLFNQLFGEPDMDDEDVSPDLTDPDLQHSETTVSNNTNEVINGSAPPKQVSGNTSVSRFADGPTSLRDWFLAQWKEKNHEGQMLTAPRNLAWRLFHQDLVTLVGMRDLWVDRRDRREPSPLGSSILEEAVNHNSGLSNSVIDFQTNTPTNSAQLELRDQRKLSPAGWLRVFMDSVMILQARFDKDPTTVLTWDKDDTDAMDFVAGASILRAQLFHLPGAEDLTRFVVKSLAGNIIPAIATTNAIIAGLMVLQARQVLAGSSRRIRTVYLHRHPTGRRGNRRLVVPCEPAPPNPNCLVCSHEATKSQLNLVCDPTSLSLRVLRDRILIRHLGMLAPDVELEERGVILISSEEGETDEDTLNKTLAEFQVIHGSRLQCDDFRQDFNLRLIISAVPATVAHTAIEGLTGNTIDSHDVTEGWRLVGDLDIVLADSHIKPTTAVCSDLKPTERLPNGVGDDATEVTTVSIDEDGTATEPCEPVTGRAVKRHLLADSDKQSASSHEHATTDEPAVMLKRGRFDSGESTNPIASVVHDVEEEDDFVFLD